MSLFCVIIKNKDKMFPYHTLAQDYDEAIENTKNFCAYYHIEVEEFYCSIVDTIDGEEFSLEVGNGDLLN